MPLTLVPIPADATPPAGPLPSEAVEVLAAYRDFYPLIGFEPPWVGYLAFEDETCVGTCGFKGPPRDGSAEIAYFTFPAHEGRGVATAMANALLALARDAGLRRVRAQTLPEENASTTILRRLGFHHEGVVEHPEDGLVWEWSRALAS